MIYLRKLLMIIEHKLPLKFLTKVLILFDDLKDNVGIEEAIPMDDSENIYCAGESDNESEIEERLLFLNYINVCTELVKSMYFPFGAIGRGNYCNAQDCLCGCCSKYNQSGSYIFIMEKCQLKTLNDKN